MAHRAMEEARKRGINNYKFFLSEMKDQPTDIISLESDLRQAVEENQLTLHYQPKVELDTEKLTGVEALLRWNHSERGMISPKTSIPLAEETGLILPVGKWVLQEACQKLYEWKEVTPKPIRMSVNVSAQQIIQERRFLDSVREILTERDINPECLEFEITETVALRDVDFTSELLNEFQEMSIQTSVDDFGTGHSTLTYLQELPYDRLKIDRSFIDGVAQERQHRVMVEAMISLAKELNLEVVAEGVETEDQLEILRDLNCDIIQGYYYAKPLPEEKLIPLLKQGTVRAS
jgi:EAL domain-containing protein (putative c-di-GMP-specific phosphodiesterase class I)